MTTTNLKTSSNEVLTTHYHLTLECANRIETLPPYQAARIGERLEDITEEMTSRGLLTEEKLINDFNLAFNITLISIIGVTYYLLEKLPEAKCDVINKKDKELFDALEKWIAIAKSYDCSFN